MRYVPVKSAAQQAALLAHRGRSLLIRQRTSLINAIRAHCTEFGLVAAKGPANIACLIAAIRDEQNPLLPQEARPALSILVDQLQFLDDRIVAMEKEATAVRRLDDRVNRLMTIPGIGIYSLSGLVAAGRDRSSFIALMITRIAARPAGYPQSREAQKGIPSSVAAGGSRPVDSGILQW
jgi:transposase